MNNKSLINIYTGNNDLDNYLHDKNESIRILEIFGKSGGRRIRLLNAIVRNSDENLTIYWIDTMLSLHPYQSFENVTPYQPVTPEDLLKTLDELSNVTSIPDILIINSIFMPFRSLADQDKSYLEITQLKRDIINRLNKLIKNNENLTLIFTFVKDKSIFNQLMNLQTELEYLKSRSISVEIKSNWDEDKDIEITKIITKESEVILSQTSLYEAS